MNNTKHWSKQKEISAGYWHFKLIVFLFRYTPVIVMQILAFPVSFFIFLFSGKTRAESNRFFNKFLLSTTDISTNSKIKKPGIFSPLLHIISFSLTLIEKIESWGGKLNLNCINFREDTGALIERLENNNGALLICSHLGNVELLRGLANFNLTGVKKNIKVTSIIDTKVNSNFIKMLQEINSDFVIDTINPDNIGPQTIILLQEKIMQGELVVIAGDRTSASTQNKCFSFPFFNEPALFAMGPFILASLLNTQIYFVFALRNKSITFKPDYNMYVHKVPVYFDCPRKERAARIYKIAKIFVNKLENYCKNYPYQWYNFFDFWAKPEVKNEPK